MELTEFLSARLAEDEAAAKAASRLDADWELRSADPYEEWPSSYGISGDRARFAVGDAAEGAHIARWDPARVLREVEAKRRILAGVAPQIDRMNDKISDEWNDWDWQANDSSRLLQHLAAVYSDHPDYDPAWA